MTLGDRVPVPPLAPERLERLEQRIVAAAAPALARPAKHALWPWGLSLASAAAAALAVLALRPVPTPPIVPPLVVSTDARETIIELGDATLAAAPATRFDVVRIGGGIDVRLDHGAVRLDVAPRPGRPPLWVRAGDVAVRVVGTAFTVARAPGGGEVTVEVEHGVVEVHRAGATAPVSGGQQWSSRDGTVIATAGTDITSPGADRSAAAAAAAIGDGRLGADDRHTPDLATGPALEVAVLGSRDAHTPGGSGGAIDRVPPRATGARPPHGDRRGSAAPTDLPPAPAGDLHTRIRTQPLTAAVAVPGATAVDRAAELRTLVAASRGAEAATALYGLARTQHVELGRHGDALRSLDAYLTRFPSGAELEAVLWLRLRILCRGTIDDACRAAAHTYATRYADTARGDIADLVKNSR